MTRLSAGLNKVLLLLLTLALLSCAASAAGTGTLHVINATGVAKDDTATVSVVLTNDYNPKMGSLGLKIYYNSAVATAVSADSPVGFTLPVDLSSPITVGGATVTGVSNGDPIIVNITFQSMKNDGSATDIGLYVQSARDIAIPPASLTVSVVNGTFTTRDEVAPVIDITTTTSVSPTFNIAGTITDVGGMETAQATLANATNTVPFDLNLAGSVPDYTFDHQVTWPIDDSVTLTVTATDAAGNTNTATQTINVVDVGFSQPEPTNCSYIKDQPPVIRVFTQQMNKSTVTMTLTGPDTISLDVTFPPGSNYATNTTPPALVNGTWTVIATGNDTSDNPYTYPWTFTLDRVPPTITAFNITDSDGDGYTEAGETLNFSWTVAGADVVHLMDNDTQTIFFNSTAASGLDSVNISVGNRNMVFAAFDNAGNAAYEPFHLYNDYMIWMNSKKMGEISGIDTTYTATKDISRTAVSSITLYGCNVTLPTLNQLKRTVTNVGQVTSDTYVTVDVNADRTLSGSETYPNVWVLDPNTDLDFLVKVPNVHNATLVLAEANESYIADLIAGGSGGMHSVNYTELIKTSPMQATSPRPSATPIIR
ncbi:MAG: Uncharacterized protein XE11_2575 [Methanomicrobiales archaeon 53_19]|nr:MAG: Uncharacterized protein XE11_2575 [Methanomicrobiales archaeon 53_19]